MKKKREPDVKITIIGGEICVDCGKIYFKHHPFFESVRNGKRCGACSEKKNRLDVEAKWGKR